MKTTTKLSVIDLPPPKHVHPSTIAGWYANTRYKPGLVLPLAVLWILSECADRDGVVDVERAKRELSPNVFDEALTILKTLGYIRVDFAAVTINHLPTTSKA